MVYKIVGMKPWLDDLVVLDPGCKMVLIRGQRQVGKITLCRQLMAGLGPAQSLNRDVAADRGILHRALAGFTTKLPQARANQLVRDLRQEEHRGGVDITDAAPWLAGLDA